MMRRNILIFQIYIITFKIDIEIVYSKDKNNNLNEKNEQFVNIIFRKQIYINKIHTFFLNINIFINRIHSTYIFYKYMIHILNNNSKLYYIIFYIIDE